MKRIILTGGGTAGHVTPNMALMPELKKHGYDIQYIGSYDGMEKKLIEDMGIPYHGISSGKLRRYALCGYPCHYPRIGYDTRTCQQAGSSKGHKGMLQLP